MSAPRPSQRKPGRTLLVGCGALGTRLGERLAADGGEVFALRRTTAGLPAAFTSLPVDLQAPVRTALPAVDAMVITLPPGGPVTGPAGGLAGGLAGGPAGGPASAGQPAHDDGYLASLRNLAAALPQVPPRVVLVSSTRVLGGHTHGRPLTERDAPAPVGPRASILLEGERLATELFDAVILRPAGIYGPGREMLLRKALEGDPVQYARRTNRIHEDDLVRTLHALLTSAEPPRLLHAVDQAPAPLGEVITYIAHRLGVPPPPALEPEEASGTVLDGAQLLDFLGSLEHPTFQSGYGQLIDDRNGAGSPEQS
ncbi:SDR family NAD(P)-dependent oxidoreductase [Citricoccus sp.]|uniref:SDR family NAD(P)-dependent oxidoreductase n=1 Tax=Citricoccus sp. TaxID=1978372 RepID=UPI0028BE6F47|nr:SDR family NAD(P)-dependent oxidoreductase [Citricoccus sp.]